MSGEFERLVKDIEAEVAAAEGGWKIAGGRLLIHQKVSKDPSRSSNGGEYDYFKVYRPVGLGVESWESWSCDFAPRSNYGGESDMFEVIIGLDGLERIARLADVTVAARAWLNKERGAFKKLQTAIRSLE